MTKTIEYFSKELLESFPDFSKKIQPADLKPFILFGDFALYLRDGINSNRFNDNQLQKIFNFLNKMGLSDEEEVHNLLTVGILEVLTDSEKATKIAKSKLKGEALKDFKSIENYWYGNKE